MSSEESLRDLPARFAPPLVGDSFAFLKDPAGFLLDRSKSLGPLFKINVFGDDVACFCGPDAFEVFLDETRFSRASASPPHVQEILAPDAVPFLEGDAFKRRKALLMQAFTVPALDGYLDVLERVVGRYARKWAELGAFAWVPEITSMGMTVAASLFVGADPNDDDPSLESAFKAAFDGMLSLPVKLPFTTYGKALRARDELRRRIAEATDAHQKTPTNDALSRLLAARVKGEKLSDDEVRIEIFHFFGAYVVVIGGLSFLAMLLGQHDDVRKKLRDEVLTKAPEGPLTVARVNEMPYLDRVCKEARRVEPVLPITFFARATKETSFRGIRIPEGMKAVGCIGPTVLDERIFPDPKRFDPDRWRRAGSKEEAAWVPHGGGTHLLHHRCAGERLADLMLKTFAVRLVRDYDWAFPPQDFSPTKGQLFATPRGGLDVRFRRLRASERTVASDEGHPSH